MISSLLFLGFLSLSSSSITPITPFSLCDGTQIIYATSPDLNGPGLSAIDLGTNEVISNIIGLFDGSVFDGGELIQVDVANPEIIRSATIDPITNQLILLFQEMLDTSSDPQQRLIRIAPSSLFGLLSTQYSNIMAMEVGDVDVDSLTEITFDCAGNLIGLTREGKVVVFEVDGVEINDEEEIGELEANNINVMDTPITDTETGGFTGLTYNWLSNTFVAVGGTGIGPAGSILVEFEIEQCELIQTGQGIFISDPDGLCFGVGDGGIIDIEFRGQGQYVVSCLDSSGSVGLAVLMYDGINVPLIAPFMASGQTAALIEISNSFGGALIPSIGAGDGVNQLCIPPYSRLCTGVSCNGEDPVAVGTGTAVGVGGFSIGAMDGSVGDGTGEVTAVDGGDDAGEISVLSDELEEVLEVLEEGEDASQEGEADDDSVEDEESNDDDDGESNDDNSDDDNSDDDSEDDDSGDDSDDGDSDDDSDDDNEDDDSDDDSGDDSDDDSGDTSDDDDDDDSDDDNSDDDDDDDDDSDDDRNDDGSDDDDDDSGDSNDFSDAEGISEEYRRGFFSNSNEYGETVISLSQSTLANLWGIGLLFLLINISFLVICYYKHWMKKQDNNVIEEVIDLES